MKRLKNTLLLYSLFLCINTHRLLVFGKRVNDKDTESVLKQEPEISDSIGPQDILNIAFICVCILFFIIFLVLFVKRR